MTLSGVLVKQVTIKSDASVCHELFKCKPHHIPEMSPDWIIRVDLLDGEWGAVGSIVVWNFFHEGKAVAFKDVIEAIDEEKKLVCYKVIEGPVLEEFKSFKFTVHVDTKGEDKLVTWVIHYEKLNESVKDPESLMDACINMTKDIEKYHLAK